jgi:hypothetical protein
MLTLLSHDFALSILSHAVDTIDVDAIAEDAENFSAFEKILAPSLLPNFDWEVAWESYYNGFDAVALYLRYIYISSSDEPSEELYRTFDATVEGCIDEWNNENLYPLYPKEPTYHKIFPYLPKWAINLSNYYEGFDIESIVEGWWGDNRPINRAIYDYNDGFFDGIVVTDSSEFPSGYRGEALVVNDHGNATLYYVSSDGEKLIDSVV